MYAFQEALRHTSIFVSLRLPLLHLALQSLKPIALHAGASVEKLGEAAACAVKRINLDMRMAYAARRAGAELREEFEVTAADFDKQQGLWTVSSADVRLLNSCKQ